MVTLKLQIFQYTTDLATTRLLEYSVITAVVFQNFIYSLPDIAEVSSQQKLGSRYVNSCKENKNAPMLFLRVIELCEWYGIYVNME